MTVAALTPAVDYVEDGVTVEYPLQFSFGDPEDIKASRSYLGGALVQLNYGVDYVAIGGSSDAGGSLIVTVAGTAGTTLHVWRETARSQTTDYLTGDRFPAESHEAALDKLNRIAQEQDIGIDRAFKAPRGSEGLEVDNISDGQVLALVHGKIQGIENDPAFAEDAAQRAVEAMGGARAAETGAVAAQGGAEAAELQAGQYANSAASAALSTQGYYPAARSFVPQGAITGALVISSPGAGGANGTFALGFTGGNFAVNPSGTFMVAGGVVTAVTITGPGLYVGNAISAPALSFAASAGLTGAAATLTTRYLKGAGEFYLTDSTAGAEFVALIQNVGNVATLIDNEVDWASAGRAKAWAQSPTAPDPSIPTSKSAKTWAEQAAAEVASIPLETIPEEGGFAVEVYDLDNYSAGGWDFNGVFTPALLKAPDGSVNANDLTPDTLARLLPSGFTGEFFTFSTESGYGFVIEDLDGYVGFGQEISGNLYGTLDGSGGGSTDPVLHAVTVWGDSMSDAGVPWLNPGEDWPSVLRSLGRTVNERAVAGQSAGQIIARQGGDPCLITLTGNQIPATTTPVAVTVKSELFVQNFGSQAAQTVTGIYCGVHASILRDAAGNTDNYTFQRTTAGTTIPAPAASPFVPDLGSAAQEDTQVIWVGRNGVASIMTTTIAKVDAAVRYLDHGRFLIVGVTTLFDGSEDAGSSNYNLIVSYNNYMAARYGSRFFDVRRYMIDQALADAGITPDSTDLADIAVDRIPTRFKESGAGIIHFNALANSLVGAKINAILNAKGY